MRAVTHQGFLASGSMFLIEVPENWSGVLLLYSRGLPLDEGDLPWSAGEPMFAALLAEGYACAGTGGRGFWPLEEVFASQSEVLDTLSLIHI